jgi:hypothetical protein
MIIRKSSYIATNEDTVSATHASSFVTSITSSLGLHRLDEKNDIFYTISKLPYVASVTLPSNAITSLTAHVTANTSAYAYAVAQLLLTRNIISELPIDYNNTIDQRLHTSFKTSGTGSIDLVSDTSLSLGKVGVIAIKKYNYGSGIAPQSFTATTAKTLFKDANSGSELHGIIVKTSTADSTWTAPISAGIIFYDVGIVAILGESITSIDSVTSLTSVNYTSYSDIKTLSVFCRATEDEMNGTLHWSSFYDSRITADPNSATSDVDYTDFTTYGYKMGLSANKSMYQLQGLYNRSPYICAVGLYNENNDLLAIGKLAQPIIKPKTLPIVFKLQIDL